MQGRSLMPLVNGGADEWREEWFYEHHFTAGGWIPSTEGIRTADWKYTVYTDEPRTTEELFDLRADPLEERNLAGHAAAAGRLAQLRARREAWLRQLGAWQPDKAWRDPA
jgi:arylsulfatase A-like enzyme